MKRYLLIVYDPKKCRLDEDDGDLFDYLVNELNDKGIKISMFESTPKDLIAHLGKLKKRRQ